jgi:hypothetical protein
VPYRRAPRLRRSATSSTPSTRGVGT